MLGLFRVIPLVLLLTVVVAVSGTVLAQPDDELSLTIIPLASR